MTTEITLSNSKINTWRRCPKKYEFKYVEKLRPKKKALPLERGSWIHSLLEVHYDGGNWKDEHKRLAVEFSNLFEEEREMLGDLPGECKRIMARYVRHWADADQHFRIIDSEMNEMVDIGGGITLNVVIDLVVEELDTGLLWAWDHKTRKKFGDEDDMILDPQLTLYFRALELMGYTPLGGVVYNEILTKPPTLPDLLKNGSLSKRQSVFCDAGTYLKEIKKHGLDPVNYRDILIHLNRKHKHSFFKRTHLPKDPPQVKTMLREVKMTRNEIVRAERKKEFPRTFRANQCKWDCDYLDLCLADMHGADISSIIKQDFTISKRGE